ncbi:MAG: hypothetical protein P1U89_23305 [Verrucomicrobiales bacterium]|nr:hypothetical protein [Verrucomicrobiales bacterium]
MSPDEDTLRKKFEEEFYSNHRRLFKPEIHPERPLSDRIRKLKSFCLKVAAVAMVIITARFVFLFGSSKILNSLLLAIVITAVIGLPLYFLARLNLVKRHKKHQIANLKELELMEIYKKQEKECEEYIENRLRRQSE